MVKSAALRTFAVALAIGATASTLSAQVTPFTGWDIGANQPGANSIAVRNAFVAATAEA